ncbi:MAG: cadherin-like domain-containing protein, partial [Planctomycetales bacterium]|nr:cadherin-like domain-containing protein [Planctomycetales bacterium]
MFFTNTDLVVNSGSGNVLTPIGNISGQTTLVLGQMIVGVGADTINVWINPDLVANPDPGVPTYTNSANDFADTIHRVAVVSYSNGGANGDPGGIIDAVLVADKFEDVTGILQADDATVSITVSGINDAPVAVDDSDSTTENTGITVDVLANDTDVDTDDGPANFSLDSIDSVVVSGLSIDPTLVTGTVSIVGNQIQFTPGTDFDELDDLDVATVTIDYTMSDDLGATDTGQLVITVNGLNDAPIAVDDMFGTSENTPLTVDVLANDTDVDGDDSPANFSLDSIDSIVVAGLTTGASLVAGSVVINAGQIDFDPATDFDELREGATATVTVGYTMSDDQGATSSATLTITVTGVNDQPVADAGGPYMISEGDGITLDASATTDVDLGDFLTYTWTVNGNALAPTTNSTLNLTWSQLQALGIDDGLPVPSSFVVAVQVNDDAIAMPGSDTATTSISLSNSAPATSIAGPAETVPNNPVMFQVAADDPSDMDDGSMFRYRVLSWGDGSDPTSDDDMGPMSGVTLTHAFEAFGTYDVVVEVTDKDGGSALATHTITISPVIYDPTRDVIQAGGLDGVDERIVFSAGIHQSVVVTYQG